MRATWVAGGLFANHSLLTIREFLDGGQATQGLGSSPFKSAGRAVKLLILMILFAVVVAATFLSAPTRHAEIVELEPAE
jgi:hypothetical protein